MVRSIGAARGAVVVADGAENVRLPRLPELPDMRASALTTVNETAATMARSASNQRWVRMVFPLSLVSCPGTSGSVRSASISEWEGAP